MFWQHWDGEGVCTGTSPEEDVYGGADVGEGDALQVNGAAEVMRLGGEDHGSLRRRRCTRIQHPRRHARIRWKQQLHNVCFLENIHL